MRTTAASLASLLTARLCGLPEIHWAVITTIIVMQSTLGAAWDVSWQRLVGTFIGGVTAAALVSFFAPGLLAFAIGMLAMGLLCAFLPRQNSAYRFAGITLALVMLPNQTTPIWSVALHRFLEVSMGILVGMAVMALWPERRGSEVVLPPKESPASD
ncbi:MAG: FUSC family protein [Planctomycetota bacterium]|nr:FUSC family protein [Planctomycetota bacterium]